MSIALQTPPAEASPEVESASPASGPLSVPPGRIFRWSLEQYHQLAESGILHKVRVELIEGLIVTKMGKGQDHIIATDLVQTELIRNLPPGWHVSMQNPVTLAESGSEPEPDAKVVRGHTRDYKGRRVGPGDTALVVEVADSSVRSDQIEMKAIYARSSVPTYWIINIRANRVEVYNDPTGPNLAPDYRHRTDLGPGEEVPVVLDGQGVARIAVVDLLP